MNRVNTSFKGLAVIDFQKISKSETFLNQLIRNTLNLSFFNNKILRTLLFIAVIIPEMKRVRPRIGHWFIMWFEAKWVKKFSYPPIYLGNNFFGPTCLDRAVLHVFTKNYEGFLTLSLCNILYRYQPRIFGPRKPSIVKKYRVLRAFH